MLSGGKGRYRCPVARVALLVCTVAWPGAVRAQDSAPAAEAVSTAPAGTPAAVADAPSSDAATQTDAAPLELELPPNARVLDAGATAPSGATVMHLRAGPQGLRARLAGADAQELVLQPGEERIVVVTWPDAELAPIQPLAPAASKSKALPSWVGTALSLPWALGVTLLGGGALAAAGLLWTLQAGEQVNAGPVSLRAFDIDYRPLAALAVVVALVCGAVAFGLLMVPFALEKAGAVEQR